MVAKKGTREIEFSSKLGATKMYHLEMKENVSSRFEATFAKKENVSLRFEVEIQSNKRDEQ